MCERLAFRELVLRWADALGLLDYVNKEQERTFYHVKPNDILKVKNAELTTDIICEMFDLYYSSIDNAFYCENEMMWREFSVGDPISYEDMRLFDKEHNIIFNYVSLCYYQN